MGGIWQMIKLGRKWYIGPIQGQRKKKKKKDEIFKHTSTDFLHHLTPWHSIANKKQQMLLSGGENKSASVQQRLEIYKHPISPNGSWEQ